MIIALLIGLNVLLFGIIMHMWAALHEKDTFIQANEYVQYRLLGDLQKTRLNISKHISDKIAIEICTRFFPDPWNYIPYAQDIAKRAVDENNALWS